MKFEKFIDVEKSEFRNIFNLIRSICMFHEDQHVSFVRQIIIGIYCGITEMMLMISLYGWIYDVDKLANIIHHATLVHNIFVVTLNNNVIKWKNMFYQMKGLEQIYNYESPYMSSVIKEVIKRKEPSIKILYRSVLFAPIFVEFNVGIFSILDKYVWGNEYVLLFPVYMSGLDLWLVYIPLMVWQYSVLFTIAMSAFGYLGYAYVVYTYISMQLEVLETALIQINKRVEEKMNHLITGKMTKEEFIFLREETKKRCVEDCAKHHGHIIRYFKSVRESVRIPYFVITGVCVFIFVSVGFTSMSDNQALKFKFYGIFVVQVAYMYTIYWIGQAIADRSQNVREVLAYNVPWWDLPKTSRMTIRLMMVGTMRPMNLETVTGQKVDLAFFMDMIKGAYSYFNMMYKSPTN